MATAPKSHGAPRSAPPRALRRRSPPPPPVVGAAVPGVEHPRLSAARSLMASDCRRRAEAMAWTRRAVTRGSGGQLAACYLARTAAVRAENQRAYPIRQV